MNLKQTGTKILEKNQQEKKNAWGIIIFWRECIDVQEINIKWMAF